MPAIVETRDLTRRYGSMVALDQLNLEIPQGAIFGFIGPNGAGKTTTMRILTTLLPASGGEAWVAGHSVLKDPLGVRKVVGFMPDFFGVYDNMKVWEYLDFFGRSYSVTATRRASMIGELLNLVDLGHKRERARLRRDVVAQEYAAVAARLRPLRDDGVNAARFKPARFCHCRRR